MVRTTAHVNILGVHVSAIDMNAATATLESWIHAGTPNYVCITGVHGVMESWRNPALREVHNAAGMVTPDGMPLVWMAHCLGFPNVRRVYGPDLMRSMTALSAQHGYRNYYFGGRPGTPERLQAALLRAHPGLQVAGTFSPPFGEMSEAEDEAVVQQINATMPDIVWVGLSTPKQERWMASHVRRIHAPVMVGVGAAFDFLAGDKRQAPLWMQRNGLEWLFRMASEPRRLAGRYIKNNPAFIYQALRQLTMPQHFPQSAREPYTE
jgi:N-acetylglucosaminyldiphosphoundecaprenol N-acetyl-beta-D-mannosaminyltransferase